MRVRKVAATTTTATATITITTTAMNMIKITSTANDGRVIIDVVVKLICSTLFPFQLLQRVHLLPESIAFPMYHI